MKTYELQSSVLRKNPNWTALVEQFKNATENIYTSSKKPEGKLKQPQAVNRQLPKKIAQYYNFKFQSTK